MRAARAISSELRSAALRDRRLHETLERNAFCIRRDLDDYFALLGPIFERTLLGLRRDQRWLNVGAGEARAEMTYKQRPSGAEVASVSVSRPPSPKLDAFEAAHPRDYRYLTAEIERLGPNRLGGQFDLVSDLFGALTYTRSISDVMRQYAKLCKVGGHIAIQLSTRFDDLLEEADGRKVRVKYDNVKIVDARGRTLHFMDWVKRFRGLEVAYSDIEFQKGDPAKGENITLVLRKTSRSFEVPSLQLKKIDAVRLPPNVYIPNRKFLLA
jgi:SAM-dependent methyltransferase